MSSCTENEGQVQEVRQLRDKLATAEQKLAVAEQKLAVALSPEHLATVSSPALAESAQKLAVAEARIVLLEQELATRAKVLPPAAVNATNLAAFIKAMEADLLSKVGELRRVLGQTTAAAHIQETSISRLPPLEKIVASCQSQIFFKVVDSKGETRLMVFPVQPGMDGQWHLPEVVAVNQQIMAFIRKFEGTSYSHMHPTAPLPLPPGVSKPAQQEAAPQQAMPDTIRIRLDTALENMPKPQGAAKAAATSASQAARVAPPPPLVPAPQIPKLIMPVKDSVQVRFEQP